MTQPFSSVPRPRVLRRALEGAGARTTRLLSLSMRLVKAVVMARSPRRNRPAGPWPPPRPCTRGAGPPSRRLTPPRCPSARRRRSWRASTAGPAGRGGAPQWGAPVRAGHRRRGPQSRQIIGRTSCTVHRPLVTRALDRAGHAPSGVGVFRSTPAAAIWACLTAETSRSPERKYPHNSRHSRTGSAADSPSGARRRCRWAARPAARPDARSACAPVQPLAAPSRRRQAPARPAVAVPKVSAVTLLWDGGVGTTSGTLLSPVGRSGRHHANGRPSS